ncbi:O-antigen ligase family protein, partial [Anaerolineales bacterium HSG24]|nr:O-antigen ligase family protein [Anaerolineales bacterium HSG24]
MLQIKHLKPWILSLTLPDIPTPLYRFLLPVMVLLMGLLLGWLPLSQAFMLVGGVIALPILLLNPIINLYLLIPFIPFSPLLGFSVGSLKIGLMEIVLFAGIGLTLLQSMVNRDERPSQSNYAPESTWTRDPFCWLFFILFVGIGLSWLTTLSIRASLVETVKWVEMLLVYLFTITQLPKNRINQLLLIILLTGLTQAMLGIYQFVFKVGPEGFLLFNGLFLRAYGTFGQPNPYAGYLGLILPLAVSLLLWKVQSTGQILKISKTLSEYLLNSWQFLGLTSVVGVLLLALFATQSRSGWLAAIGALGMVLFLTSRVTRLLFLLFGVMLVTLTGLFSLTLTNTAPNLEEQSLYQIVLGRFVSATEIFQIEDVAAIELTGQNFATLERLAHWQAAWHMWRDNFWLGVGFGNYEVVYPAYAIGRWEDALGHAHNYLFNMGAETGFVGIVCYLIFWILTFRVIWQIGINSHGFERAVVIGCAGILVHLHLHNLFDNLYVQGM